MSSNAQFKLSRNVRNGRAGGFTLIELLVVISVIAVLAGLLLPAGAVASRKMKESRVRAELDQLVTLIETYKLEVGEYPPDHGDMAAVSTNAIDDNNYSTNLTTLNPLYYELNGAVFKSTAPDGSDAVFQVANSDEEIKPATLQQYFKVGGIRNSSRVAGDIPYKNKGLKASQYKELDTSDPATDVEILAVAVPNRGFSFPGRSGSTKFKINPWHYDSSSKRRRNRNSFDLWAEIDLGLKDAQGNRINKIIGNWKD